MIKSISYVNLSPETRAELQHHIDNEFGHVAFVQAHTWAQPDWSVIKYEGNSIAAFYNIVVRDVTIDGQLYKVAGINNVITPKAYRGKGFATEVLRTTEKLLFKELECSYGLLLCADALLPFYSRLGWYLVQASLYYDQPSGKQLYDSNVMILTPNHSAHIMPSEINLNGLPW
ncbi:GNAT family N-acetyltransferase [Pontibacter sp. MBLB2868]|uniref:GNAT family N-acetyltransferase n=1 Tax=Pontibacter sp. MBLB2868 TaxID=3451555 RepID=UPI003F752701